MPTTTATPSPGPERIAVAILHHPTDDSNRPIPIPAMGLLSIADFLDRHGIATQIIHLGLERALAPDFDAVADLARSGARIAALSAHWFFQLPDTLRLARAIKQALPDVLVVLGGFSASIFAGEIIAQHPAVDVVVRGEGEIPLLELCRRHLDGGARDLAAVPNLVFRTPAGGVAVSPGEHAASAAELDGFRFANLKLLRHHERYPTLIPAPSRRFRDRLHFEEGGIFPLAIGRGCPYRCTFCGGNREAQRLVTGRTKPVFRSIDSVLATVREAMSYGYRGFYACFDPAPNGPYYHDLFARIRREGLDLRFIFGAWGLPDHRFIDAFHDTFQEGLFELSPETSNEELRRRNKGALSFTNAELRECLAHLEDRGVCCQAFFGYFLAGDTIETVLATQRFAHEIDRGACEALYLAFSSDPGSLFHLHPEEHGIERELQTLEDYLRALGRPRRSPNLLAHRPRGISAADADALVHRLAVEQHAHKVLAATLPAARSLLGEGFAALMAELTAALADRDGAAGLRAAPLLAAVRPLLTARLRDRPALGELLCELAEYETTPYAILEDGDAVGAHYTSYCHERALDGETLRAFLASHAVTTARRDFRHDVKQVIGELRAGRLPAAAPAPTRLGFAVDRAGEFVTYYASDAPLTPPDSDARISRIELGLSST